MRSRSKRQARYRNLMMRPSTAVAQVSFEGVTLIIVISKLGCLWLRIWDWQSLDFYICHRGLWQMLVISVIIGIWLALLSTLKHKQRQAEECLVENSWSRTRYEIRCLVGWLEKSRCWCCDCCLLLECGSLASFLLSRTIWHFNSNWRRQGPVKKYLFRHWIYPLIHLITSRCYVLLELVALPSDYFAQQFALHCVPNTWAICVTQSEVPNNRLESKSIPTNPLIRAKVREKKGKMQMSRNQAIHMQFF